MKRVIVKLVQEEEYVVITLKDLKEALEFVEMIFENDNNNIEVYIRYE